MSLDASLTALPSLDTLIITAGGLRPGPKCRTN